MPKVCQPWFRGTEEDHKHFSQYNCIPVDSPLTESSSATSTATAMPVAVSSSVRRCGGHSVCMSHDGKYVEGLMNGFGLSIITRNSLSAANRNPRFCFDLVWSNYKQCSIMEDINCRAAKSDPQSVRQ